MNNKYNIIHFSIQKIKSQIIFNLHFNFLKKYEYLFYPLF